MRKNKPITEQYLKNYAIFYLEKFDNSAYGLKRVLERQVYKKSILLGEDHTLHKEKITNAVNYCIEKNYINDNRYSENLVIRLKNKGFSKKKIILKLQEKGIEKNIYEEILSNSIDEMHQSIQFIKKKKLGVFDTKEEPYEKQLAKLARNGFSYNIAQKVLHLSREEIEELEEEIDNSSFSL